MIETGLNRTCVAGVSFISLYGLLACCVSKVSLQLKN